VRELAGWVLALIGFLFVIVGLVDVAALVVTERLRRAPGLEALGDIPIEGILQRIADILKASKDAPRWFLLVLTGLALMLCGLVLANVLVLPPGLFVPSLAPTPIPTK